MPISHCLILVTAIVGAFAGAVRGEPNLVRPPGTTRYEAMVQELHSDVDFDRTDGYHRMSLSTIGKSVDGRGIWMVVLHDRSATDPGYKVFYICRQHGHEPASTEGALHFISEIVHAARGTDMARCLERTTLYIVPMANPDGAEAFLRHNAHDVDLNRDWLARTQPETRALYRAIEEIQPDLVTDQHEMFPDDPRPDFTETICATAAGPHHAAVAGTRRGNEDSEGRPSDADAIAERLPSPGTDPDVLLRDTRDPAPEPGAVAGSEEWRQLVRSCMDIADTVHVCLTAQGNPIRCHWINDDHPARLAHRYMSVVAGIPAILFETNRHLSSRTVAMRASVQEAFMNIIMRYAAGEHDAMIAQADGALGIR